MGALYWGNGLKGASTSESEERSGEFEIKEFRDRRNAAAPRRRLYEKRVVIRARRPIRASRRRRILFSHPPSTKEEEGAREERESEIGGRRVTVFCAYLHTCWCDAGGGPGQTRVDRVQPIQYQIGRLKSGPFLLPPVGPTQLTGDEIARTQ